MCILFVFVDPKPQEKGYRFIAASNRDEYYRRPAQILTQENHVIGGKDLEDKKAGGMWLGVSVERTEHARFRFGALLNVTGEPSTKSASAGRGFIVTNYLKSADAEAEAYIRGLLDSDELYNAFNFVAAEISATGETTVHHCSNAPAAHNVYDERQQKFLGFGNSTPATPLTKVKVGLGKFEEIVGEFNDASRQPELIEEILKLLKNESRHLPDEILERKQPEFYPHLSSIFIKFPAAGYGTRTHSIVLVDAEWNAEFHEVTMEEPIDPERPVWRTNVRRAKL